MFCALLVVPARAVVFHGNFDHEDLRSGNYYSRIVFPANSARQIYDLTGENSKWSIWGFLSEFHFFTAKKYSPPTTVMLARYRTKILNFSAEVEVIGSVSRDFAQMATSRIIVDITKGESIHTNIRPISEIASRFADFVGVQGGTQLPMDENSVDDQPDEGQKGNRNTYSRYDIKSSRKAKLLLAVFLIFGISLFLTGARLNFYGITHAYLFLAMIGWWLMVFGTMLVLGPLSMFLAQEIGPIASVRSTPATVLTG